MNGWTASDRISRLFSCAETPMCLILNDSALACVGLVRMFGDTEGLLFAAVVGLVLALLAPASLHLTFPRLVEDEAWVRACAKLIEEEGADQFLVNLLSVLRECFQQESTT